MSYQTKVALVHDDFIQVGGAESLFATIASIWPQAPIYTSLVNWKKLPASIDPKRIHVSWMQKIPFAAKFYKLLLPFYPLAFESFDFDDFDIVLSSTTRFAKSIITKPSTVHICYVNSLPRFLYNQQTQADYLPVILRLILRPLLAWLKRWDRVCAQRVDYYIANSQNVSYDLLKNYQKESIVIYPFADLNFFKVAKIHNWRLKRQNYFFVVSRLVKWKKIDIAIRVSSKLNKKLIIVGEGPDKKRLIRLSRNLAGDVEFVGKVTKESLRSLYQNCQALIVTQQEDFGIAAVEAQACGRPVVAYQKGGQQEIISDQKTGMFFGRQSEESLEDAILAASGIKWSVSVIRQNALRFYKSNFIRSLKRIVDRQIENVSQVSKVPQVPEAKFKKLLIPLILLVPLVLLSYAKS